MSQDRRPDDELLVAAVGAMVFASDEPVRPREIARALGGIEPGEVRQALDELAERHERAACGLRLERIAGGVRLVTRPEIAPWLRRLFRERNRTRLTAAALETLAIVAYRQPVTVPEIQAIRGRDPSAAVRGLLEKKLIRILGRKKVVGSPLLYGTTKQFLMHFGLDSLSDLPSIEDFEQFVEVLEARRAEGAGVPLAGDDEGGADDEPDAGASQEDGPDAGAGTPERGVGVGPDG